MKEIEIPEGYEARIEGNKVIFKLKESEDEKIRKEIIKFIQDFCNPCDPDYDKWIAYLEKQKEQKPTSFNEPYNSDEYEVVTEGNATSLKRKEQKQEIISISEMVSKYRNTDEYDNNGNYKGKPVNCMIRAYEKGIRDTLSKVREQKPTEWSEEDEVIVKFYEDDYNHRIGNMPMKDVIEMRLKFKDWVINRIKYLRPQPKQEWSEEDKLTMDAAIYWLERRLREEKAIDISTENIPLSMRKTVERLKLLCSSWKPSENEESKTGNRYEKY